jgi:hypothetical protein
VTLMAPQTITLAGLQPVYTAVTASDTYVPNARGFIEVVNAGGSPDVVVLTVQSGDPPGGLAVADISVSVTNGQTRKIGPLPPYFFADPALTGTATVTHSFTTTVTAGYFVLSSTP